MLLCIIGIEIIELECVTVTSGKPVTKTKEKKKKD